MYFAGVIIVVRPFDYDPWLVGFLLTFTMLALFLLALVLQVLNGNSKAELDQLMLENDAREMELMLSIKELQKDTMHLVMLRNSPSKDPLDSILRDDGARRVEWSITAGDGSSKRPQQTSLGSSLCRKDTKGDGFNCGSYPCYVVAHTKLRKVSRLPCHEDALAEGLLEELMLGSRVPAPSHSYFVSQARDPREDSLVSER